MNKLLKILTNPKPYVEVAWMRFLLRPIVWRFQVWFYRTFLLHRIVRRVSCKCNNGEPIKVLFLAMTVSYWKYDTLYRKMAKDSRFDPMIMPAMRTGQSFEDQMRDHDEIMSEFARRSYHVLPGYDRQRKQFNDPMQLRPDIVFYAHPYSGPGRLRKMYDFWAMRRCLVCHVPYYFLSSTDDHLVNNPIQNMCWQYYCPNEAIKSDISRVMNNGGVNLRAVGYPFGEELAEIDVAEADFAWRSDRRKRIIWAPHHSIENDPVFRTGTFLRYCDFMRELAIKYADKVVFAFKPHPVLFSRLEKIWGRERTQRYYDFWQTHENTIFQNGGYHALFKGSDALIHDSGSFQREYLETCKPCQFLYREDCQVSELNEFGEKGLAAHYAGRTMEDIEEFIVKVVLQGDDPKAVERSAFYETYLRPPSGRAFSDNVIEEIVKGLGL